MTGAWLAALGLLVVFGSVLAGYGMAGGEFLALNQPAELLIVAGAAVGAVMIGTPSRVLTCLLSQLRACVAPRIGRQDYMELLPMLYQLLKLIQQCGVMALESHLDEPKRSAILSACPRFCSRPHALDFLADSVRAIIMGGIAPHDLEALMDDDRAVLTAEASEPAVMLNRMADALPGLGVVAAVLGVVITMAAVDGPPSEIGHKVGAALVGTFLGVLLSYGLVQPLATHLEHRVDDEAQYLMCIKAALLASQKGLAPAVAIEFARRAVMGHVRPSFDDTERACRMVKTVWTKPEAAVA